MMKEYSKSVTTPGKYTVGEDFLNHLSGKTPLSQKAQDELKDLWLTDKWSNLIDPPTWLTVSMF